MMRRNKSAFRVILSSPITLVLAAIILVFLVKAASSIRVKAVSSADKLEESEQAYKKLEASKSKVEKQLENLRSEEGIAAEIREKYHAVEPGEKVAVVINTDQNKQTAQAAGAVGGGEKKSWWRRLLGL